MDSSTLYLIINAVVYAGFLFYITKHVFNRFTATSFVVGWYLFSAISSVLFYTHPITPTTVFYAPISWQGLMYFTGFTFALIYPIYRFEKKGYELENSIKSDTLIVILRYLLVLHIIVLFFYFSDFLRLVNTDYDMVRDAATNGDASTLTKKNPIVAWCLTFSISLRNISTILGFYAIVYVRNNRRFIITFFAVALIMPFFHSVLYVMRSYIVFQILLVLFLFILFRDKFSNVFKRNIYILGGFFLFFVITFMVNVSDNRFGDMVTWYYYKYAGETFVNFSDQLWPNLKDCTGGTVYFQWLGKLIGIDFEKMSLSDKWSYMNGITGIDTHIFYGFIGGLVLEFNFIPTAFIIVVLVLLLKKFIFLDVLRLSNLILLGELAYLLFSGSFLFAFQGMWGNFEMIFVVLSYIYFKRIENKNLKYYESTLL